MRVATDGARPTTVVLGRQANALTMAGPPTLPTRPLTFNDAFELSKTVDEIDMMWPLWGRLVSDVDLVFVSFAVFDGRDLFILGYDPAVRRWAAVSQVDGIRVSEPDVLWEALGKLEAWLHDRFEWERLTRL